MPRLTTTDAGLRVDLESDAPGVTRDEVDAWLEASKGGFTNEQLEEAFAAVRNAEHWKGPIDAVIDADLLAAVDKAVPFYTGTSADFEEVAGQPGRLRVTAPGYWAGPCN